MNHLAAFELSLKYISQRSMCLHLTSSIHDQFLNKWEQISTTQTYARNRIYVMISLFLWEFVRPYFWLFFSKRCSFKCFGLATQRQHRSSSAVAIHSPWLHHKWLSRKERLTPYIWLLHNEIIFINFNSAFKFSRVATNNSNFTFLYSFASIRH